MSSSGLVRLDGGLASIVAGVLLLLGHVLTSSVLAAHILLVFALVALSPPRSSEAALQEFLGWC
jgi:hypothetical protein